MFILYTLGYILIPASLMTAVIALNDYFSCDDDDIDTKAKYIVRTIKYLIIFVISLIICSLSALIEFSGIDDVWEYLYWVFLLTVIFFLPVSVLICLIKNLVRFIKASRDDSQSRKKRLLIPFMISISTIPACVILIIVFGSEMSFM